jgi:long-chain fatty acid transport protein
MTGRLNFSSSTSPFLGLGTARARADITVPASITGSITQAITPDFSLSSDIQYTFWDVFKEVAVLSPPNPIFTFEERYRNSWMISVGGVYTLNRFWTLRGGVGYDQSPVVDRYRDTGVPDKDRIMLGVGAGYNFSERSSIDLGYAHYFATGHATMNTSVNRIDPVTGAVVLNGTYDNSLNYVALTYRQRF